MKPYTFDVTVTSTAYRTLTVELRDGLTEEQVEDLVNKAIEDADLSDMLWREPETEIDRWPAYDYGPVSPPDLSPLPIPDDAWIAWRGRRYATDGSMLVREDTPPIMRGKPSDEWYSPRHRYGVLPSAKLDELERDFGPALGDDPLVWPRVAPIAIAAAAVSSHRSYVVFRDDSGEILAIAPAGYAASGDALVRLSTLRGAP